MRISSSVLSRAVLALFTLIFAGALSGGDSLAASESSRCEEIRAAFEAWVASVGELPREYDEISELPLRLRQRVFSRLSPSTKATLWRTHLKRYISDHPALSAKKVEAITTAASMFTPSLYERSPADPTWDEEVRPVLEAIEATILGQFDRAEARSIVAILGPPETAAEAALAGFSVSFTETVGSPLRSFLKPARSVVDLASFAVVPAVSSSLAADFAPVGAGALQGTCDCSMSSPWCFATQVCSDELDCDHTSGCGSGWSYPCDGECMAAPIPVVPTATESEDASRRE